MKFEQRELKFRALFEDIRTRKKTWQNMPIGACLSVLGSVQISPILQFTGLKDRFGKEIYEGDIVKTCRRVGRGYKENEISIVTYSDITARYYPHSLSVTERCEVIGNIFENTELIEKK